MKSALSLRGSESDRSNPRIMGILNVTPDSFSDGGLYLDPVQAVERALQMEAEGADMIDIGGESSRPGAISVSPEEELRRTLPVIKELRKQSKIPISIDTTKASVAVCLLEAGANMINDISAGRFDPEMFAVACRFNAEICLMHMLGNPQTMQQNPQYTSDVVYTVKDFLKNRAHLAIEQGMERKKIWIDPGIGFGKRLGDNLALLNRINELKSLNFNMLIGISRKSFIEKLLGHTPPEQRLAGSLAGLVRPVLAGIGMVRVHDVKETRHFLTVLKQFFDFS